MRPFFSVIVPTLNEEMFLPYLLEDLKNQKSKNFEVVVVDANSKDNTRKIARTYKKNLKLRIFMSNKKNVSYQKNLGAKNARGIYLLFIDADCKLSIGFTKKLEISIKSKKGLIFFPYIEPEEKTLQMKTFYKFLNFIIDKSQNNRNPFPSIGCMCFERNFFNIIDGFDESVYSQEDYSLAKKSRQWGVIGSHLPKVKFIFSFRKIRKEGKLESFYKLFIGYMHYLLKGDVKKKIFESKMGGHIYNEKEFKSLFSDTKS